MYSFLTADGTWCGCAMRGALLWTAMTATVAMAETETASLDISAIIPAACKVGEPDANLLVFASPQQKQLLATSSVEVTCPSGTPYSIRLNNEGSRALQPSDKLLNARPIPFSAILVGSDPAAATPTLNRIGTGSADQAIVQIKPVLTGNEIAGSYSEQLTLTIDW